MNTYEKQRVIEIYGKDYSEEDVPSYIRNREKTEIARAEADEIDLKIDEWKEGR